MIVDLFRAWDQQGPQRMVRRKMGNPLWEDMKINQEEYDLMHTRENTLPQFLPRF